jgi:nucleoside-triphosphatase THEP1
MNHNSINGATSQELETYNPDPLLARLEYGSCLILGRSGSGKSSLLREAIGQLKSFYKKTSKNENRFSGFTAVRNKKNKIKLITVNARSDEYDKLGSKKSPPKRLEYKSLCKASPNSVVIIEDIISMSASEERCLRQLLNYDSHHKHIKVFMIAHHVYKTSIHTLLGFFNYIIFTSDHTNVPLIRITLAYFKIDSDQIATWLTKFKSSTSNYSSYYFFDCKNLSFNKVTGIENLLQGKNIEPIGTAGIVENSTDVVESIKRNNLQDRFDKFVAGQSRTKSDASAIFSMIIHCLPLKLIREHDLTLIFGSKSQSSKLIRDRVSFVDYIDVLLTSNKIPDPKIIFLHKFVQKSCQIPKRFIVNQSLQNV